MRARCTAGSRFEASQKRTIGSPVKIAHAAISSRSASSIQPPLASLSQTTSAMAMTTETPSRMFAARNALLPNGMSSFLNKKTK